MMTGRIDFAALVAARAAGLQRGASSEGDTASFEQSLLEQACAERPDSGEDQPPSVDETGEASPAESTVACPPSPTLADSALAALIVQAAGGRSEAPQNAETSAQPEADRLASANAPLSATAPTRQAQTAPTVAGPDVSTRAFQRVGFEAPRPAPTEARIEANVDAKESVIEAPTKSSMPQLAEPPRAKPMPTIEDSASAPTTAKQSASVQGTQPSAGRMRETAARGMQPAEETRRVEVRHVSSTTHYPVVGDPVRQIASHVASALDASAPSLAAHDSAAPVSQPVKTMSVQLEPESLGTVTLRLRLSGNQLSIRVDVAEPATLDMIQRERDRLEKTLAADDVALDRLEIRRLDSAAPAQGSEAARFRQDDPQSQNGLPQAQGQPERAQEQMSGGDRRSREKSRQPSGTPSRHDAQDSASNRVDLPRGVYL